MMVYIIEFYAYLPKISIHFFLHFDFRSDPDPEFFFSAESDPDPWKKMSDPHPWIIGLEKVHIICNKCVYFINSQRICALARKYHKATYKKLYI